MYVENRKPELSEEISVANRKVSTKQQSRKKEKSLKNNDERSVKKIGEEIKRLKKEIAVGFLRFGEMWN